MSSEIICPHCNAKNVIQKGFRKVKFGRRKICYFKDCTKKFTVGGIKYKGYRGEVITKAITYYNLGNSLNESIGLLKKTLRVKVPTSTIHNWLNEYKGICTYHRIRKRVLKECGKDVLIEKVLRHKGLTYNFKYHKAKLELFTSRFPELSLYLEDIEHNGVPDYHFENDERCSQLKIDVGINGSGKRSHACRLASLALVGVKDNRERHDVLEYFMLANDTCTVAVEVPGWFWEKTLDIGITGHIDILQVRYGKIYILDYKPDAEKEKNAASQLYLYALGVSFRTGIPLKKFICAWFDSKVYYEFAPLKAKVKW